MAQKRDQYEQAGYTGSTEEREKKDGGVPAPAPPFGGPLFKLQNTGVIAGHQEDSSWPVHMPGNARPRTNVMRGPEGRDVRLDGNR